MGDNDPQPPRISFEEDFKAERRANLELKAQLEDTQRRYKSQGEENSRLRKKLSEASEPRQPEPEPAAAPPAPAPAPPTPAAEPKVHAMSITDAYCPECRQPNAEFKDETECKNCGRGLGAIATLPKVKACPGCGLDKMPDGSPLARKRRSKPLEVPHVG